MENENQNQNTNKSNKDSSLENQPNQENNSQKEPKVKKDNKNKIEKKHLHNLDEFIQNCLNKFKFIEPLKSFYDMTGRDQDSIISHKSTIPDLVIWNKPFNKNECFEGANLEVNNVFPRYRFYLRLNKDSKAKNNKQNTNKEKKNKKNNKKNKKNKNKN